MRPSPVLITLLLASAIAAAGGCHRPETLTAEAASDKGDALLRQMSRTLAAAQTFTYNSEEHKQRVRSNGEKVEEVTRRAVRVKRPDGIAFVSSDENHDGAGWYDGQNVTFVSNKNKVWARGPMPPTIDEALDFFAAEYGVAIPTADLLYSSPYDALMTTDTTGGWVGEEKIGDQTCDHLAYKQAAVDWELWLTQDDRKVPRQLRIVYKTQPGSPWTRVEFTNFNPNAQLTSDAFVPNVPQDYRRIKMMRYGTIPMKTTDAAPAATPAAPAPR